VKVGHSTGSEARTGWWKVPGQAHLFSLEYAFYLSDGPSVVASFRAPNRHVEQSAGMSKSTTQPAFSERVYAMVRRIPYGKACSYGDVAALLGHPRAARGVGQALAALPQPSDVPWWRVVNRNGELSIPHAGRAVQRMLLLEEGVAFVGGRVDLRRHGWQPHIETSSASTNRRSLKPSARKRP